MTTRKTTGYDGVKMPKVLHTIEHEYGTCAKTCIPKLPHNMKHMTHTANKKIPWFNFEMKLERAHMNSLKHKKSHIYWPHLEHSHAWVA